MRVQVTDNEATMEKYALTGPDGVADILPLSKVDPTVDVKPGWQWLPYVEIDKPILSSALEMPEPNVVVLADRVERQWLVTTRAATFMDVARERDRRLSLGFNYDFGDARGIHRIGTTRKDIVGWSEVSTYAGALIDSGDTTTTIMIVTDTGPCAVTAPEWRAIEIAAAAYRQPIWAGSFVLQSASPTPADYATNDSYWT